MLLFFMVLWIEQRSSHNVGKSSCSELPPPSPSSRVLEGLIVKD